MIKKNGIRIYENKGVKVKRVCEFLLVFVIATEGATRNNWSGKGRRRMSFIVQERLRYLCMC